VEAPFEAASAPHAGMARSADNDINAFTWLKPLT